MHTLQDRNNRFPGYKGLPLNWLSRDRIVTWQLIKRSVKANLLLGRRNLNWLRASMSRAIGANIQAASGVINTIGTSASINGAIKSTLVRPAVEKVAMETVASRVTHSPDPAIKVFNRPSVVEEFEKHRKDGDGV